MNQQAACPPVVETSKQPVRPLAIDIFTGLHGWADGLVAEGWDVIGFDIVDMCAELGMQRPKGVQLVLQDALTLHGRQFKDAALIVASPPCQEYSYMAMPWGKAKKIAAEYRSGARDVAKLTALFDACFRIQREAIVASGRHIPMVVENVKGAQPWVGRSRWNFGSFHLWGDVPALMPVRGRSGVKSPGLDWNGFKNGDPNYRGQAFNPAAQGAALREKISDQKNTGGSWFNVAHNTTSGKDNNPVGRKGDGGSWFHENTGGTRGTSSNSKKRKAASALIAKIPTDLARHIGRVFHPSNGEG